MRVMNSQFLLGAVLQGAAFAMGSVLTMSAQAAAPGITGPAFQLNAAATRVTQPDGKSLYAWGYGCSSKPSGFAPANITGATCPAAQLPGPTLIVTEGATVTVMLTNNLPAAAGNTSILFPGFQTVVSKVVSSVSVTPGGPYASTPTVTFSGGGGTGATGTATIDTSGTLTAIAVNNP